MASGDQRDLAAFQFVPPRGYLASLSSSTSSTPVRASARPPVADTATRMTVRLEENLQASEKPATLIPALEGGADAGTLAASSTAAGGGVLEQGAADVVASAVTIGGRAARAVEALPGTWMAAGLPKWVHTMRRRMITKEDYLHTHAVSGVVSFSFYLSRTLN